MSRKKHKIKYPWLIRWLLRQRIELYLRVYKYCLRRFRELTSQTKQQSFHAKSNGKMVVSGHAFQRYFERVEGYDLETIAKELTEGLPEKVALNGDGKYVVGRARVTVIGDTVVTVDTKVYDLPFKDRALANPIRGLKALKASDLTPDQQKDAITATFDR